MYKFIAAALGAASLLMLGACQKQDGAATSTDPQSTTAAAGDGINGTWKADVASAQVDRKPTEYLLKDGQFSCPSCTPPLKLAADGAFHPVTGRPYADSMSMKIDGDHDVTQSAKKGDQVVGETKYSVSADGETLTVSFTDTSVPNAKPVTGKYTETRVAEAPAGSHALSGSWKMDKYDNVSDEGTTETFALNGDTLHMSTPAGLSYDAKLDGTDAPTKGDIAGTTASVKKTGDNVYEETDKQGCKVVSVTTMTLSADGKMHVVTQDKQTGATTKYDVIKQ